MYKYLVLSALLALVAVASAKVTSADINRRLFKSKAARSTRPVTRQNASIEEVPYQIAVELFTIAHGAGSLISEDWVLTVARLMQFPSSWFTIRAGSEYYQRGGSTHMIAKRILHENFTVNEDLVSTNDIALLRVNTPFRFDRKRQPLALYNAGEIVKPGDISVITGWGIFSISDTLQTANLQIVSRDVCQNAFIELGGVSKGQICATYSEDTEAPCVTDPGAPLVIRGHLAGMYSWGNGCMPGMPEVFTEVASYRDWIRDRIGF